MITRTTMAVLAAAALLTACGSQAIPADGKTSSTAGLSAVAGVASTGYAAVSDVTAHAALGRDAKAIRDLLGVAKEGKPVDWTAVGKAFREGGASKKGDGSLRTLAGLAKDHPAVGVVNGAIDGTTAGSTDTVRAQQVDKGITVLLAAKVLAELEAAGEKVAKGEKDANSGAPHNVDEAWAFFTADGQGPAVTADKRAKDFKLDGQVTEAVLDALSAAQRAALAGSQADFEAAEKNATSAVNYVFYLATFKYLDHGGTGEKRAEGESFYLGIAQAVSAASPDAASRIAAAFAAGDAAGGREALNSPAVLTALLLTDAQKVTTMP